MPYTVVALARTGAFADALSSQKIKETLLLVDAELEHISAADRLASFCLISVDDVAMREALRFPGILMYWLIQMESDRTAVCLCRTLGQHLG